MDATTDLKTLDLTALFKIYEESFHYLKFDRAKEIIDECQSRGCDFWTEYVRYVKEHNGLS